MACTKIRYPDRSAARRARREIGDAGLRPYRCHTCDGEPFHLGHLAAPVKQGRYSRSDVYGDAA